MAREILFRGKRTNNGEWVTGTPFIFADRCKMIQAVAVHPDFVDEGNVYYSEGFPVDPETVGQFTGLTDKDGKRIFEGDIIKSFDLDGELEGIGAVNWSVLFNQWQFEKKSMYGGWIGRYEVIGNIHDNPELLNGKES